MREYNHYEIHAFGGVMRVSVDTWDIRDNGEHNAVVHEAWRKVYDTNGAREMLKDICDRFGVDAAKKVFSQNIKYERV
jgi:hypothetical protein